MNNETKEIISKYNEKNIPKFINTINEYYIPLIDYYYHNLKDTKTHIDIKNRIQQYESYINLYSDDNSLEEFINLVTHINLYLKNLFNENYDYLDLTSNVIFSLKDINKELKFIKTQISNKAVLDEINKILKYNVNVQFFFKKIISELFNNNHKILNLIQNYRIFQKH